MKFLRRNWVGVMFCGLGLLLVVAFPIVRHSNRAYRAAPACRSVSSSGCRVTREVEVTGVRRHGTIRDPSQELRFGTFGGGAVHYSANFSEHNLGPGAVQLGEMVSVEIWHGKVTAMTVGKTTYRSYVAQSAPWWLVPMGLLLAVLGVLMIKTGTAGTSVS